MSDRTVTGERKRRALEDLRQQGVAPTRENIVEQDAVRGGANLDDAAPVRAGGASVDLGAGRGGPQSEIATRRTKEAEDKKKRELTPAQIEEWRRTGKLPK